MFSQIEQVIWIKVLSKLSDSHYQYLFSNNRHKIQKTGNYFIDFSLQVQILSISHTS